MGINFSDGSTQNHGAKIIQVKDISWNTKVRLTSEGYFFGSANDATYSFTPKSSSNHIVCQFNFAAGRSNTNGGLKILVNGGTDTGGQFYWDNRTTDSYASGYDAYAGAFNTADDSWNASQHDYSISHISFTLVKNMSASWPSTFYLGGYWENSQIGSGVLNLNRTNHDASHGHAISNIMIYEMEDI
tara:strand:- start:439 stop:999 length:561 start_codon:yes stop_codon:yes gene_type:complete